MGKKVGHLLYNILNIVKKIFFFFYVIIFDVYSIFCFLFHKISKNTVLIIEPNNYHGEILPGYVKYFQDLGYNVELFIRHKHKFCSPFCLYPTDKLPLFFVLSLFSMKLLFKLKKINHYKVIFFSTSSVWKKKKIIPFVKIFSVDRLKEKIFCVEHDIGYFNIKNMENLSYLKYFCDNEKVFTLSDYKNFPSLLPCYFGDIVPDKKLSLNKKRFLSVGTALPYVRNNSLMIDVVDKLVKNGYTNLEVIIVAKKGKICVPKHLKSYIKFMKMLSFKELFGQLQSSDFFLACLDASINEHHKYLNGTTTGSKELVCSFIKPFIISKVFADAMGFNDKNSVIYKDNDLYDAMLRCLNMKDDEYFDICKNLKKLSDKFYNTSYRNLKDRLKKEY